MPEERETEENSANYSRENPSEVLWWDEVQGYEEIPEIETVFEKAGVDPLYRDERDFADPERAFDEDELEDIQEAAREVYDGDLDLFKEKVAESTLHPQQSKQVEKYIEYSGSKSLDGAPTEFHSFDGMPVLEKNSS